ncbi:PilT protein domain protein [Candidatus Methylobacter favarea]|uniref:PilT protein domain protein n=1 Tax=Candidatus Methylobacter favarea TaxID=2707345 RepID=A0A8S0X7Z2_9GAMM|nr:PIN domain-containing protein [Candidatus Methylobacter favarea]CAA9890520.1 PilT protein domain protein [Candidatus Methylobacter favarea]
MTARVFADTNLFVYAESQDQDKSSRAIAIIQDAPVISTQVINETVSVLTRKHGFLLSEAHEIAGSLLDLCEVVAVDAQTIRKAIDLAKRYSLSHWDSLIIASALLADCHTLFSEDMQHGQVFDNQLKVINPFIFFD